MGGLLLLGAAKHHVCGAKKKKKKSKAFQERGRRRKKKVFLPLSFSMPVFGGFVFENCAFQFSDVSDEMTGEPSRVLAWGGKASLVRDGAGRIES